MPYSLTVGIYFGDDGPELSIVNAVAHHGENRPDHRGRDAALLVVVEAVEHLPQHLKNKYIMQLKLSYLVYNS